MNARVLLAATILTAILPAASAAQPSGAGISVQGGMGSNINAGGYDQSVSFGFAPGEHVEFLVSAERIHIPTRVTRYPNGSSVSRNGTTTFISGEVRFTPFWFERASPYVLVGVGRGTARPNVNDYFPNGVSHDTGMFIAGGGVRVPLTGHLSAFADVRCLLQIENSEAGLFGFLPVRGGVAWRF